jgi:hypothetical protein
MGAIKNIRHMEHEEAFQQAVVEVTQGHITCDMLDAFRSSGLKRGRFKDGKLVPDAEANHPAEA